MINAVISLGDQKSMFDLFESLTSKKTSYKLYIIKIHLNYE